MYRLAASSVLGDRSVVVGCEPSTIWRAVKMPPDPSTTNECIGARPRAIGFGALSSAVATAGIISPPRTRTSDDFMSADGSRFVPTGVNMPRRPIRVELRGHRSRASRRREARTQCNPHPAAIRYSELAVEDAAGGWDIGWGATPSIRPVSG